VNGYLRRLIEYNNWANKGLLAFLATFPAETLDASAAGVYGTVRETLNHLFEAEDNYFRSLTLQSRSDFSTRPLVPRMEDLRGYAHSSAGNLDGMVLPDPTRMLQFNDGMRSGATALTQLFMHGVEHRTHVATILGARGIEPPDLDSWAHGIFTGGDDWPPNWGEAPVTRPRIGFEA
jgi:uncharacterized damage-inducible protein DinB